MLHTHHSHNLTSIEQYAYVSPMRLWSTDLKLLLALGAMIQVLAWNQIIVSLFVLITMTGLLLWKGKTSIHALLHGWSIPFLFIIIASVTLAIGYAGQPVGDYRIPFVHGYLYMSRQSLHMAASVTCKAMGSIAALYMLTYTTPIGALIDAMDRHHVPSILIELMYLIYRFIFVLSDVHNHMKNAAEARLGYRNFRTSLHTFADTSANLLVQSMDKANRYYDAMEARGYTGQLHFWNEEVPASYRQKLVVTAYLIMIFILGITGYLFLR